MVRLAPKLLFCMSLALIGLATVMAAPSPVTEVDELVSGQPPVVVVKSGEESSSSTDVPVLPTLDPVKEAKVLSRLAKHTRGGVDEVKRVRSLLDKNRAKVASKHAKRSDKEKNEEKQALQEMNQMEAIRTRLNQGAKLEDPKQVKRISNANLEAGVGAFMYQGDIRLTEEQAKSILGDSDDDTPREKGDKLKAVKQVEGQVARPKRQALLETPSNAGKLWDTANAFYSFASDVPAATKTLILKAIDLWERNTCINFYEDASQPNSMQFTTADSGCWSYVGSIQGLPNQTVSIQAGGCEDVGVIAHEIGHALGLYHTMARTDRPSNVYVFTSNVDPNALDQWDEASDQQSFGSAYDLSSIMHYFRTAFRAAGKTGNTQTTKVSPVRTTYEWDQTIGQDRTPSIADFKLINNLYNCPQWCSNSLTCVNGGYQRPGYRPAGDGCTTCVCPPGVGGASCNTPVSTDIAPGYAPSGVPNTCTGARLTATTSWKWINGSIGSTSQDTPADWAWCHWWIQAPTNYHLQIEVTSITAACGDGCGASYLEVRTGNANFDWGIGGRRICCSGDLALQNSTSLTFVSPSNNGGREAMISSYNRYWKQSFTLRYKAEAN